MENKQIEDIYNQTFAGLTLFYRDTTLSESLSSRYQIGQILTERGFTDMTYKGGGLATNVRYLIASANAKDLSAINPNSAQFGHVLLSSNAFFKVLDIFKIENKTQVFLLEIPENAIDLFKRSISNIEENIIKKARESFETKINYPFIPALLSQDWKNRTESPIGMSDTGEFFYETDHLKQKCNGSKDEIIAEKPWWKFW